MNKLQRIQRFLNKHNHFMGVLAIVGGVFALLFLMVFILVSVDPNNNNNNPGVALALTLFFGPISIFSILTIITRTVINKKIENTDKIMRQKEQERRSYLQEKEREEKELLRQHIDLILEKVNDKYRVKLVYGDGEIKYLRYKSAKYDFPSVERSINQFRFNDPGLKNFPEEALPTIKKVIEHYQKWGIDANGNLNPEPEKVTVIEKFIISRPTLEDPPDLRGIDTIHDLAPILIEAESQGDSRAINKVLDKMELINNGQLRLS